VCVWGGGQGFNAKIPIAGLRTALQLWGLQLTITITGRSKGGGTRPKESMLSREMPFKGPKTAGH
jgi:hypothetical protein